MKATTQTASLHSAPSLEGRIRTGLFLAGSLAAVGALLGGAASGQASSQALTWGGGGFVLGAVIAAMLDWRVGLILLGMIALGEDSVRKALPDAPYTVTLGKDFVVAACYASFLFKPNLRAGQRRDPRERMFVLVPILIWGAFVILQVWNPRVPHILVGISGVRTWLLFVPVLWLVATMFREPGLSDKLLRWVAYLSIPMSIVALLQNSYYHELPLFLANSAFAKYHTLESGTPIRYVESVFATPTMYALVCVFHLCLCVGLLKSPRPRRQQVLLWIAGYCAVMGAHLSGVRTGLMFVLVALLAMMPVMLYRRTVASPGAWLRRPGLAAGGLIGLMVGAGLVASMKPARFESFRTAFEVNIVGERMEQAVEGGKILESGALGLGTGTGGKSGNVMLLIGQPSPSEENLEWGTALIGHCYGYVGKWLGGLLLAWLMGGLLALAMTTREGRFAPLRYTLWVYLGAQMGWFLYKAYPVMENASMVLLFWSSVGLIIGLTRSDSEVVARAGGSATTP